MISRNHYEGYSFALFELATEVKKTNLFKKQAKLLLTTFKKQPEYIQLLSSYSISFEIKQELLKNAFKSKLDVMFYRLLFILIKKKRVHVVTNILSLFIHHVNSIADISEGIIYSSIKISDLKLKKIEKITTEKIGMKITLKNIIDNRIIAGFKIVINDIIIDTTVLNQLESMKQMILKHN